MCDYGKIWFGGSRGGRRGVVGLSRKRLVWSMNVCVIFWICELILFISGLSGSKPSTSISNCLLKDKVLNFGIKSIYTESICVKIELKFNFHNWTDVFYIIFAEFAQNRMHCEKMSAYWIIIHGNNRVCWDQAHITPPVFDFLTS